MENAKLLHQATALVIFGDNSKRDQSSIYVGQDEEDSRLSAGFYETHDDRLSALPEV